MRSGPPKSWKGTHGGRASWKQGPVVGWGHKLLSSDWLWGRAEKNQLLAIDP